MKKILLSLVIVVLVIGSFFYSKKEQKMPATIPTVTSHIKKETPVRLTLKQTKYEVKNFDKLTSSFPKECRRSLVDLSSRTLEDSQEYIADLESFKNFFGPDCFKAMRENKIMKNFIERSSCPVFKNSKRLLPPSCLSFLLMLKAQIISEQTSGKRIEDMTPEELAANVAQLFFSLDQLKKEDFSKNIQLLDALKNMYPNDPGVTEAYLGYLMIGKQMTKDSSANSRIDSTLENDTSDSFKVEKMKLIKEVLDNNDERAKSTIDQLQEKYPNEPDVSYYYASYYWKKGNAAEAKVYLDQAIKLSQNCNGCSPQIYMDTKKRLENATSSKDQIFTLSIGLNFEDI